MQDINTRRTKARAYYSKNRDRMSAYARAYHAKNRERCKEYRRKWDVKNAERKRNATLEWKANNKERERATDWKHHLRTKYGMTEIEYDKLLRIQRGRCAICDSVITRESAAIDHCHNNHHIRGILCNRCNLALGSFRDDIELLQSAIDYLSIDLCKRTYA